MSQRFFKTLNICRSLFDMLSQDLRYLETNRSTNIVIM